MTVIKGPVVYCDVDDTLVRWDYHFGEPKPGALEFVDPVDGKHLYLEVIQATVDALKRHYLRGHQIVVWSQGGAEWAEEVVEKLGLSSMVSAVLDKPTWYMDDIPASDFMPESKRRDYSR